MYNHPYRYIDKPNQEYLGWQKMVVFIQRNGENQNYRMLIGLILRNQKINNLWSMLIDISITLLKGEI